MLQETVLSFFGLDGGEGEVDYDESERIDEVFTLAPGAHIEVSDISGPVEVECAETDVAEVHILRRAHSRADLAYHRIVVEQTPSGLLVRRERDYGQRPERPVNVRQHVSLKLPRRVSLVVARISGPVRVGAVDGPVSVSQVSGTVGLDGAEGEAMMSNISGSCRVGRAGGRLELNHVSGSVEVGEVVGSLEAANVSGGFSALVSRLDERGIRLSSVRGQVELNFKEEANINLNIRNVTGGIYLDLPGVADIGGAGSSAMSARIGGGLSPVSISNVSGSVRLARRP
jgi:hypothetical protein